MRLARRALLLAFVAAWIGTSYWHAVKPLPAGTHVASAVCTVPAADLALIADITAADAYGHAAVSQAIFDEVLRVVRAAHRFVVIDYAQFGPAPAGAGAPRPLAAQLTEALVAQRRAFPNLQVLFITDPTTERYGGNELGRLREAGVAVVNVDLDALRDSNLIYSGLWRLTVSWWDSPHGTLRYDARRLNFKADHRKVILADDGHGGLSGVIGSANPRDDESAWSNTAARLTGGALPALLASELAVAQFSGWRGEPAAFAGVPVTDCAVPGLHSANPATDFAAGLTAHVQALTEGAFGSALMAQLDASARGDAIEIAAYHLADRAVIEALLAAARRGVTVRLILDPNEDAGSEDAGMPNQPLATELVSRSNGGVQVRWYRTHGERFHSALNAVYSTDRLWLSAGSANLTRKSLQDFNLDANLAIEVTRDSPLAQQAHTYFDTLWSNSAALGIEYTADFAVFANPSQTDYWLCRGLEGVGLAPF